MPAGPGKEVIQVVVSKKTANEIRELAAALNESMSGMTARLLDSAIEDNAFIIKYMAGPFRRLMDRREARRRKPAIE